MYHEVRISEKPSKAAGLNAFRAGIYERTVAQVCAMEHVGAGSLRGRESFPAELNQVVGTISYPHAQMYSEVDVLIPPHRAEYFPMVSKERELALGRL